jgi:hypothetical protein
MEISHGLNHRSALAIDSLSFITPVGANVRRASQVVGVVNSLFVSCLVLICLTLTGCTDISDQAVSSYFAKNRNAFERMAKLGVSSGLSCQARGGKLECNEGSALTLFEALHRDADVNAVQARSDIPELGNAVYFVVANYGLITTNSYSKGVIYSTSSLLPVVSNTDEHPEMRFRFKPLADHWYVFTMP